VYKRQGQGLAHHYYGGGNAIPLKVDSSKVTIKFDEAFPSANQQALLAGIDRIVGVVADDHAIDDFMVCTLSTGENYYNFADSVEALDGVYSVEPFYRNQSDSAFLVGTRLCVAFEENLSSAQIESINTAYNTVIDHEVPGMPNVYVLRNTDSSGYGLLDLANTYYEMSETRYSHPEFGVWIQKHAYKLYDYYADYQPHTKRVIGEFNTASVWDFAGLQRPITVAVIDDGVDPHEDLPASRLLPGYDYADTDNDPSPGYKCAHGMACAGIIAASHTTDSIAGLQSSSGTISLYPFVNVLPIKIFHDGCDAVGIYPSDLAAGITAAYASGADVLSNSWGYGFSGPGDDDYDVLSEAIENATLLGRGGCGCPVIFSAGNAHPWISGVLYPAWLPSAFSVGATHLDDYRWGYSSYGLGLDMVAPSGDFCLQGDVWTLDQMSNLGNNPNVTSMCDYPVTWNCGPGNDQDYDCNFGGTSAACPIVSGTAALLLAKDSTLSAQQVYDILRGSAVTELDWGPLQDTPHVQYGYGRVDAFRAVLSISHGDINNDGADLIDVSDLVYLVDWIYVEGPAPFPSTRLADVDCSGGLPGDIADIVYLVDYMFTSGPPPVRPCFEF